ncbi:MAG TPA: pseudouridine synthase [Candidatus Mcinerneyibacteriales bacterium]|nr:pseudouridine synthase [Candidatus Mcinerneyibacteriales bacterium]
MKRLSKYIAETGYCSRRKADDLIAEGKVTVNGARVTEHPCLVRGDEDIRVEGKELTPLRKAYYKFYKPTGFVCSHSDKHNKTIYDYLGEEYSYLRYIGRLDKESEGLLILTNDGSLVQRYSHPSFEVSRSYEVTLDRELTIPETALLCRGVVDEGETLLCDAVEILRDKNYLFHLHTGRKREIRRMVRRIGGKVLKLKRTRYGDIKLGELKTGELAPLSESEMKALSREGGR